MLTTTKIRTFMWKWRRR